MIERDFSFIFNISTTPKKGVALLPLPHFLLKSLSSRKNHPP